MKHEYGLELLDNFTDNQYDAAVLAVAHKEFKKLDLSKLRNGHNGVICDIKGVWEREFWIGCSRKINTT